MVAYMGALHHGSLFRNKNLKSLKFTLNMNEVFIFYVMEAIGSVVCLVLCCFFVHIKVVWVWAKHSHACELFSSIHFVVLHSSYFFPLLSFTPFLRRMSNKWSYWEYFIIMIRVSTCINMPPWIHPLNIGIFGYVTSIHSGWWVFCR